MTLARSTDMPAVSAGGCIERKRSAVALAKVLMVLLTGLVSIENDRLWPLLMVEAGMSFQPMRMGLSGTPSPGVA